MEFEQLKESKKIEEKFEEKREGEAKEEIKFEKKISKAEKRKIIIEIANVFDYYKKDYEEKLKLEKQMGFETLYTEMVRENLRKLEEGERQFREGEYPPIFDKIISFYYKKYSMNIQKSILK